MLEKMDQEIIEGWYAEFYAEGVTEGKAVVVAKECFPNEDVARLDTVHELFKTRNVGQRKALLKSYKKALRRAWA